MKEHSIAESIESSILGAQTALGAICSQYEQTAQRSIDMASRMAHTVQCVYKANMKIGSTFKPAGNGKVCMSLIIENRTILPATSMTGQLKFETEQEVDISHLNAYRNEAIIPNLFDTPCNLAPQTLYTQEIEIHTRVMTQCNGSITLSFMNPLSPHDTIELKHEFGLYLIDQFKKEILNNKFNLEFVDRQSYSVAFLRATFEIQPKIGIHQGMCVVLSSLKYKIVCEVINVSEDFVQVKLTSNNQQVTHKLIKELSLLCSVF